MARMAPPVETVKMVMSCVSLTFFRILSRVSLEKVSRPEAMRMMYLRPSTRLEPVAAFVERVEEIGIGSMGMCSELIASAELALVLGEVGDDLGAHVEGHQRHVVLGAQLVGKGQGGVAHVVDEVVARWRQTRTAAER